MRIVQVIALMVISLAAVPCVASAEQLAVITVGTTHSLADAGLVIAHKRGYFRGEGLDVRVVFFDHPAKMAAPMATGQISVVGAALTSALIEQLTRGDERAHIVADKGSAPVGHGFMPLMVRKDLVEDGRVKSLKDLKGLRIGHAEPDVGGGQLIAEATRRAGLKPTDIHLVGMGAVRLIPALSNRSIDGAVLREPAATLAMQTGKIVRLAGDDVLVPGRQAEVLVFSDQFVTATPAAAREFAKAYIRGVREYNNALVKGRLADPAASAVRSFLAEHLGLDDANLLARVIPPALNPDGRVNEAALKAEFKALTASGSINANAAPEKLIDHRFVDWAAKQLGAYARPK